MTMKTVTSRELADLLDELDRRARSRKPGNSSGDAWANRRNSDRRPFRTNCTVAYWDAEAETPVELRGRTRNLSRLGLSVLTRREFAFGEPIEISFSLAGSSPLFMSGLVRFCRYAGQGHYEVGVAMHRAGDNSIFLMPEHEIEETQTWLRDAIAEL